MAYLHAQGHWGLPELALLKLPQLSVVVQLYWVVSQSENTAANTWAVFFFLYIKQPLCVNSTELYQAHNS